MMLPSTAPTMAAVGTESPPDCEGLGDSVAGTPIAELAEADVEVIETSVEENAEVVWKVVGVGVGIVEPVTAIVDMDALGLDAGRG